MQTLLHHFSQNLFLLDNILQKKKKKKVPNFYENYVTGLAADAKSRTDSQICEWMDGRADIANNF